MGAAYRIAAEASSQPALASLDQLARPCPVSFEVAPARNGDHHAIHGLLRTVFHQPSAVEFQAQLDAPRYEPADRLVIKRGHEVVAHVQLNRRIMRFGSVELPATDLRYLAALPEYRHRGLADRLVEAAHEEIERDGTVVATARTRTPGLLRRHGWVSCGRFCYSTIRPHDLLAYLEASRQRPVLRTQPAQRITVRLWRYGELDELMRMFEGAGGQTFGTWRRLECDWRWLISRRAYDRIFIAVRSRTHNPSANGDPTNEEVVGYAIMRDERIVELLTCDGDGRAAKKLLTRVCCDAIETGRHLVELDAPPDDPLHELLVAAGGHHVSDEHDRQRYLMARLVHVDAFLQRLRPVLAIRARAAKLEPGTALGLVSEKRTLKVSVNKRSVSLSDERVPSCSLSTSDAQLQQLLLGHRPIRDEIEAGRARASSSAAQHLAAALFPALPFWRPPFDDLAA
jgi:predicted acetyltransferase